MSMLVIRLIIKVDRLNCVFFLCPVIRVQTIISTGDKLAKHKYCVYLNQLVVSPSALASGS